MGFVKARAVYFIAQQQVQAPYRAIALQQCSLLISLHAILTYSFIHLLLLFLTYIFIADAGGKDTQEAPEAYAQTQQEQQQRQQAQQRIEQQVVELLAHRKALHMQQQKQQQAQAEEQLKQLQYQLEQLCEQDTHVGVLLFFL